MKPTGATKEATGHSPLPWQLVKELSDYADGSAGSHYSIWADNDMTVALTVGDCVPHERGNAQLIVTAVNERERLREALRFQRDALHDLCDDSGLMVSLPPSVHARIANMRDDIDAALNEVEG